MEANKTSGSFQSLRRAILIRDGAGLTDGQLLESYIENRDEDAFSALVRRHGPMVWGVCYRMLSREDAEDAFQATFLVLVHKAASITPRERVGNWLYGVARRSALLARRTTARQRLREVQVTTFPEARSEPPDQWQEATFLLDQELSRLPEKHRAVIVLCDLQGQTRREAARALGVPEGTVAGWLARARTTLAKRLTRQGIVLPTGTLAALLSPKAATATMPVSAISSTLKATGVFAPGQPATVGMISANVNVLTTGVLKIMLFSKLKTLMIALLILTAMSGVGLAYLSSLWASSLPGDQARPDDEHSGKRTLTDRDRLQGTWHLVEVSLRGEKLKKVPENEGESLEAVFKGDQFEMRGFKINYTLDPTKKPKQIDLSPSDNDMKDEKALGIYELQGDTFKICFANPVEERPTEFKSIAGKSTGVPEHEGKVKLYVFERAETGAGK